MAMKMVVFELSCIKLIGFLGGSLEDLYFEKSLLALF
jgi:hypothetical protein